MDQRELFTDLEPRPIVPLKLPRGKKIGAAATPGTGPEGETCRSCMHYERLTYHRKTYLKCGLMRDSWTRGPGTDIKAGWPACKHWGAKQ